MDVHEPSDLGERAVCRDVVLGLRLGFSSRAVEGLRAGGGGCWALSGNKVLLEVPQEVKVAVDVYTNGRAAAAGLGVAVLAPKRARGLVISNTVWVDKGEVNDTSSQDALDLGVGIRLPSIGEAGASLVGGEQIGNPVDEVIGATTLTCMDASREVQMVLGLVGSRAGKTNQGGGAVEGLVGEGQGRGAVHILQGIDGRVDLVDVHDAWNGGARGLGAQSLGGNGAT